MQYLVSIVLGYLIGAINPSYIIGAVKGVDLKKKGSGNAGASNALILLGKATGVICALLDIGKTCLAVAVVGWIFPDFPYAMPLTALFCVVGHIFPFYLKFKGGKGLACLGGAFLIFDWRVFLIVLALEIVLALIVDYICIVPLSASVAFPAIYAIMTRDLVGMVMLCGITVIMVIKHIENLKRIRAGTELRLSFLWNKNREVERIKQNIDNFEEKR